MLLISQTKNLINKLPKVVESAESLKTKCRSFFLLNLSYWSISLAICDCSRSSCSSVHWTSAYTPSQVVLQLKLSVLCFWMQSLPSGVHFLMSCQKSTSAWYQQVGWQKLTGFRRTQKNAFNSFVGRVFSNSRQKHFSFFSYFQNRNKRGSFYLVFTLFYLVLPIFLLSRA